MIKVNYKRHPAQPRIIA